MKRITILFSLVVIVVFLLSSCEKISNKSNAQLIIKATKSTALKSASASALPELNSAIKGVSAVVLDTFLINIRDIKFELDESNPGYNSPSGCSDDCNDDSDDCAYKDVKAEGPYLLNILSPEVLNGMVLDNYNIPNAVYDEIEFSLACYTLTDNNKMAGRSVYIAGTINGKRFKGWTNKVKEIEIEFHDQSAVSLTEEKIRFYIDISLEKVKANLEAMNLEAAVDGNKNGYIEIGNNDPDGNRALSGSLIHAITGCFDLDDQDDHDDAGDDH
jgi:hypothetical protein